MTAGAQQSGKSKISKYEKCIRILLDPFFESVASVVVEMAPSVASSLPPEIISSTSDETNIDTNSSLKTGNKISVH